MKPIEAAEIQSLDDYEISRPSLRSRIFAVKGARRVHVGDALTLLFENRETLRYQIQEMLRVERIVDPKAIRHEIATYNELLAGPDELSATLLIEYADAEERDRMLRRLLGLEDHLSMTVDGHPPCRAVFDARQIATDRISSVHYVKFPLGAGAAAALAGGEAATIAVDHPQLQATARLSDEVRAALVADLAEAAA